MTSKNMRSVSALLLAALPFGCGGKGGGSTPASGGTGASSSGGEAGEAGEGAGGASAGGTNGVDGGGTSPDEGTAGGTGGAIGTGGGAHGGGAGGTGQGGAGGSGVDGGLGGVTAAGGSGGCATAEPAECEWESFDGVSCDDATCCGAVSCVQARCLNACTGDSTGVDTLAPDFEILAQICGMTGTVSIIRPGDECERPVVYAFDGTYDADSDLFDFSIDRFEPSVQLINPTREEVFSMTWASPGGPGNAVPATFGVNPGETQAVFTATLDTYESTSFVVDLETGTTRTIAGVLTGRPMWLDDDHFLVGASALGLENTGGIYRVDTTGTDIEATYVAGQLQNAALGLVEGELLAISGAPSIGGTESALLALPLSMVDEVIAGDRNAIDLYTDAGVQRIPRQVWELQGFFPAGRWWVSPANAEYTEYRIETMSINDGALELGAPTHLGVPGLAGFTPLYAGNDRLLMVDYFEAILVDFK